VLSVELEVPSERPEDGFAGAAAPVWSLAAGDDWTDEAPVWSLAAGDDWTDEAPVWSLAAGDDWTDEAPVWSPAAGDDWTDEAPGLPTTDVGFPESLVSRAWSAGAATADKVSEAKSDKVAKWLTANSQVEEDTCTKV
jgi:hypothetical protein